MLERPAPLDSGMEVYLDDALHAAHPEDSFAIDDGADVSRDVAATLKRILDSPRLEIVVKQTGITAYP